MPSAKASLQTQDIQRFSYKFQTHKLTDQSISLINNMSSPVTSELDQDPYTFQHVISKIYNVITQAGWGVSITCTA
ncbi:MAG TPA: hypothetical protein VIS10_03910, partial [Anaerolineales bacterium]